jgi:hypothetical protein
MHRQEMERRRIMAKEEKYRKSQYQKALQQENHRLSLVQSVNASNKNAASVANANSNTNTTIAAATTAGASNNNAVQ